MKKIISALLSFALILSLCGCDAEIPEAPTINDKTSAFTEASADSYYYSRLSEDEKEAYNTICKELPSHPERIRIPNLTLDQLNKVFIAVSYDNPMFICLGNSNNLITVGGRTYLEPTYNCSAEECDALCSRIEAKASEILSKITPEMSDYEKELFFHDELFTLCDYDDSASVPWTSYTIAGTFLEGSAVCEGYARAMKYLMDKVGINNYLITGKATSNGGTESHMWNIVTIGGADYHLDLTWDDPTGISSKTPSHAYFNVTDEFILKDHSSFEPSAPNCTATEFNYHRQNGLYFDYYNSSAVDAMAAAVANAYSRGDDAAEFIFADSDIFNTAISKLIDGSEIHTVFEKANNLIGSNALNARSINYHTNPETNILFLTLK